MCKSMFGGGMPSQSVLPPPPTPQQVTPAEALKTVQADQAAGADNTLRRLAARSAMQQVNSTGPLGLTSQANVERKALLGQ